MAYPPRRPTGAAPRRDDRAVQNALQQQLGGAGTRVATPSPLNRGTQAPPPSGPLGAGAGGTPRPTGPLPPSGAPPPRAGAGGQQRQPITNDIQQVQLGAMAGGNMGPTSARVNAPTGGGGITLGGSPTSPTGPVRLPDHLNRGTDAPGGPPAGGGGIPPVLPDGSGGGVRERIPDDRRPVDPLGPDDPGVRDRVPDDRRPVDPLGPDAPHNDISRPGWQTITQGQMVQETQNQFQQHLGRQPRPDELQLVADYARQQFGWNGGTLTNAQWQQVATQMRNYFAQQGPGGGDGPTDPTGPVDPGGGAPEDISRPGWRHITQGQAIEETQRQFQQHLGRQARPDELQLVADYARQQFGWNGGSLTNDQWQQVASQMRNYFQQQLSGGGGSPPDGGGPPPTGPDDISRPGWTRMNQGQAIEESRRQFQQFLGRQPTDAELQEIAQYAQQQFGWNGQDLTNPQWQQIAGWMRGNFSSGHWRPNDPGVREELPDDRRPVDPIGPDDPVDPPPPPPPDDPPPPPPPDDPPPPPPPDDPPPPPPDGVDVLVNGGPEQLPPNLRDRVPGLFPEQERSALSQQVQDALQQLISRGSSPVSLSDPNVQPMADLARSRFQRAGESMRSAAAERAAADGTLESGGFDAQALGYEQDARFAGAQAEVDLVQQEMQTRRAEMQQGIQMAMASGQFEQAQQLQTQLALLEASLSAESISNQRDLGMGDIGLRRELGTGDLGLRRELGTGDLGLRRELGAGDLNLRRDLGTGDLNLRRELGGRELDNSSRGLDIQRELGQGDIGVRRDALTQTGQLGRGDLGLRLLQSLMQNDQFFAGQGLSAAQLQAILNQNAIQQLLNGF